MPEQHGYYTLTEDIKSLIQYVQHYTIKHPVVEAANRLNKAIKKGAAMTIKEYRDTFDEEKRQYAEDSRTHEKPWELWEWQIMGNTTWSALLDNSVMWLQNHKYRRKQSTFVPEYYSGLNCKDAKHLIGKVVEGTNYPNEDWKIVKLLNISNGKQRSGVFEVYHQKEPGVIGTYEYIRTVEEILVPEHSTINIGGVELPMPETVAPPPDTVYWMFGFGAPATAKDGSLYDMGVWPHDVSRWAKAALKNGTIHLTEERAKAWSDWWNKEVLAKIEEIDNE